MSEGIGLDLVDLPGFEAQLAIPGSVFLEGTFTQAERRDAAARPVPARSLAARFAAKEAFLKAWDATRYGLPPLIRSVDLREIEVVCDAWGRPTLVLHGAVAAWCGPFSAQVSLSHDGGTAAAVVVLRLSVRAGSGAPGDAPTGAAARLSGPAVPD